MEELALTGIAAHKGQAKLVLRDLPPGMRTATAVLVALAEAGVSVDMISEAAAPAGQAQLQVTVAEDQLDEAQRVVRGRGARDGRAGRSEAQRGLSRLALVGSGMHQRPGVYARAFRALLDEEIDVFAVSTSGISITLLVDAGAGGRCRCARCTRRSSWTASRECGGGRCSHSDRDGHRPTATNRDHTAEERCT